MIRVFKNRSSLWLTVVLGAVLAGCAGGPKIKDGMALKTLSFDNLPNWSTHDALPALTALKKSCAAIVRKNDPTRLGPSVRFGTVADWRPACDVALADGIQTTDAARAFFETHFTPHQVIAPSKKKEGLITGYYEPVIEGSRQPMPGYDVPLFARPADLVTVDLGRFRADLRGRRIAGRVMGGRMVPFESRFEIENGALDDKSLELVWLKDPVDAFFLHIQGSGRVRLPNGELQMVGYAGPNGHPYTSIGRILINRGEIAREDMSMQAIRSWIELHPDEGVKLMQENRSYVFFRNLEGDGPIGGQGVALTPMRSLAVDQTLWAYGVPIWVAGSHPDPKNLEGEPIEFHNLMIAQDTGGAIRGAIRGDVFCGMGEVATLIAGHMANRASFFALLPKAIVDRGK